MGFVTRRHAMAYQRSSGLYDFALSESVLDYMDFDGKDTVWSCIE